MTADYSSTEAQRLIAEARSSFGYELRPETSSLLADQLEAAGRELEANVRLHDERLEFAIRDHDKLLTITAERDSLRQQLEDEWGRLKQINSDLAAAQRRIAELEDSLSSQTSNLGIVMRSADFRQQRIAELEACCTEHEIDHAGLVHDLRQAQQMASERASALRAFYPVYRAAVAYVDGMRRVAREAATGERGRLIDRISVARAAVTPEILAALERAGLECK